MAVEVTRGRAGLASSGGKGRRADSWGGKASTNGLNISHTQKCEIGLCFQFTSHIKLISLVNVCKVSPGQLSVPLDSAEGENMTLMFFVFFWY